ncbi:MAG TPA: hypothetical protein VMW09_09330 [Desulfatiglandales bacterium]|nr:hypothetical protein [Desulfatiglandales bacterium]
MSNKRSYFLLIIFALFSLLLLAGCGMRALLTSQFLPDNDWPKKRVMVIPATDLTGIALHESIDTISEELTKSLQKTGCFNLYPHNKTKKSYSFTPGEPIDPELLTEAKERGMNAIIFETLNPIELNPGKSGIWPFRKKAWSCTVSMNIDIVDVISETILLSKEIADNITLSSEETTEETEKGGNTETKKRALKECLPDILKEAANAASLSLNQKVWTGRIVSIDTKEIIINAGSDVGLRPGVVLEVFSKGEYITSFNKQTYQLPGPKAGEIKIVSIQQHHSFAEPIKEGNFKPGQIIRIKD